MAQTLTVVDINYEDDVVTARQRARQVARLLAFEEQDQTRISTALSEIARLFVHSHKGARIEFELEGTTAPQVLLITISLSLAGAAESKPAPTALADSSGPAWESALIAARRLMDQCEVRADTPDVRVVRL